MAMPLRDHYTSKQTTLKCADGISDSVSRRGYVLTDAVLQLLLLQGSFTKEVS